MNSSISLLQNLGSITNIDTKESVLTDELSHRIQLKARELREKGLEKSQRALIFANSDPNFFVNLFAIWNLDACAIPIDPTLSTLEVENVARASSAQVLIDDSQLTLLDANNKGFHLNNDHSDALVLFTSGTTRQPKGFIYSFEFLIHKINLLRKSIPVHDLQNTLCFLPTSFGHGLICNSLLPVLSGHHLFLSAPGRLKTLLSLGSIIDDNRITFFSSVPAHWKIILTSPPPLSRGLRRVHCASAPLSQSEWNLIQSWCKEALVKNIWGMTEFGGWISGKNDDDDHVASGFVGHPWGVQVKTNPSDSDSKQPKELLIKIEDPCARPFSGGLQEDFKPGEWYPTKDLGYISDSGSLTLVGRKSHTINCAGLKVQPEDVESVLISHPDIEDVCVFGLPDNTFGEIVCCVLVFKSPNHVSINQLRKWCQSKISAKKIPRKWLVQPLLPRNLRGKIDRASITSYFSEKSLHP